MMQPNRIHDASGIYRRRVTDTAPAGGPAPGVDAEARGGNAARGRRWAPVSLSSNAQSIRRVFEAVNRGSDVRTGLVERLCAEIADGSYKVDARVIAQRLVAGGLSA